MPRPSKPWYWKARKEWYVKINGERIRLGPDKEAAKTYFHALMAKPDDTVNHDSAIAIIDEFLLWCEKERPASYDWYYQFLNPFCKAIQDLSVSQVAPSHVTAFIDKPTWGPSAKRAAVTAIKRAFNWAVNEGRIPKSPVKQCKKPEATIREQIITREMHDEAVSLVNPQFADLLEIAWETGARPFELYRLETRHLELDKSRVVFPKSESKGKKKNRVVYFSPKALDIVKRNMWPSGPVLRNTDGEAWTVYSINCSFLRLQTAIGLKARNEKDLSKASINAKMAEIKKSRADKEKPPLKEGALKKQATKSLSDSAARKNAPKYCLYSYRHSFAHRKLSEGMDSMVLATLMGHSTVQMLDRVYGHIHKNADFLLAQLSK